MRRLNLFTIIFLFLLLSQYSGFSQVKIGDNEGTILDRSLLELESTDKALMLPRLSDSLRDAVSGWNQGHIIYNTTETCIQQFNGVDWNCLVSADSSLWIVDGGNNILARNTVSSDTVIVTNDGKLGINTSKPNEKLTVVGNSLLKGHIGLGSAVIDESKLGTFASSDWSIGVNYEEDRTSSSLYAAGYKSVLNLNPTGTTPSLAYGLFNEISTTQSSKNYNNIEGIQNSVIHSGNGNVNRLRGAINSVSISGGDATTVEGEYILAQVRGTSSATDLYGMWMVLLNRGSGIVENAYGIRILDIENRSTGSISNAYGVYVDSISANNKYSYVSHNGAGNMGIGDLSPTSKLTVNGPVASPLLTTTTSVTLDNSISTVILTGGTPVITLPAANTCEGREYTIVNNTLASRTVSAYVNFGNSTPITTTIPSSRSIVVQSDGTFWYRTK